MGRSQVGVAFTILLATCLAGVFHAPWYSAAAGACSLALLSLLNQRAASGPRLGGVSEPVLIFSSVLNAAAVASGVFAFGHVARWAWGL